MGEGVVLPSVESEDIADFNVEKTSDLKGVSYRDKNSDTVGAGEPGFDAVVALEATDGVTDGHHARVTVSAEAGDAGLRFLLGETAGKYAYAFHLDARSIDVNGSIRVQPTLSGDSSTYRDLKASTDDTVKFIPDGGVFVSAKSASSGRFGLPSDDFSGWVLIPFDSYQQRDSSSDLDLSQASNVTLSLYLIKGNTGSYALDDVQLLTKEQFDRIAAGEAMPKHFLGKSESGGESGDEDDYDYDLDTGRTGDLRVDFNKYQYVSTLPGVVLYAGEGGSTSFKTESQLKRYLALEDDGRDGHQLAITLDGYDNGRICFEVGSTKDYEAVAFWIDTSELPVYEDTGSSQLRIRPGFKYLGATSTGVSYSSPYFLRNSLYGLYPEDGTKKLDNISTSSNDRITLSDHYTGWVIVPFSSFASGISSSGKEYYGLDSDGPMRFDLCFLTNLSVSSADKASTVDELMKGAKVYLDDIQLLKDYRDTPIHGPEFTGQYPEYEEIALSEGEDSPPQPTVITKGSISADFDVIEGPQYPYAGDYVIGEIIVENNGKEAIHNVQVTTSCPPILVNGDQSPIVIPTVEAGQRAEVTVKFKALAAGRGKIQATVLLESGVKMNFNDNFTVMGAGWLAGDNHTHTIWSDGKGTIRSNANAAYDSGLSWLYSTDHSNGLFSNNNGELPTWQVEAQNEKFGGAFVILAGTEVTTGSNGHSPIYNVQEVPSYQQSTVEQWTQHFLKYKNLGAFSVLAHPFREIGQCFWAYYDAEYYFAVEAWNGAHHPLSEVGQRYFKGWDDLNTRGRTTEGNNGKIYAFASSDGHTSDAIGDPHIVGYFPVYPTVDEPDIIHNVLLSGCFYGTNGPDLRFDIDGAAMGSTLYYTEDGQKLTISLRATDDYSYLKSVKLIKGIVTGQDNYDFDYTENWKATDPADEKDSPMTIVKEWDLTGQNLNSWADTIEVIASDKDFYRIEVTSEKGKFGEGGKYTPGYGGFAFSNPIWVEKADSSSTASLTSVSYDGQKLSVSDWGNYYLTAGNTDSLDIDKLTVDFNGASHQVAYDSEKDSFIVTVTAQNGKSNQYLIGIVRSGMTGIAYKASENLGGNAKAAIILNFNTGSINSMGLDAWGTNLASGEFSKDNLSLVEMETGKALKAVLSYPGDLEDSKQWGENVVQIPVGSIEENYKEISFWVDMSHCAEVTTIKANMAADEKWWEVNGDYYLIYDDPDKVNETKQGSKGEMTLPAGFVGFVNIPLSSYSNTDENYAFDQSLGSLKFNFYLSRPLTGTYVLLDNLQKRETGAPYLTGDETGQDPDDGGSELKPDARANMLVNFNSGTVESLKLEAWGKGGADGLFDKSRLSIAGTGEDKQLQITLVYPVDNADGWGVNVVQIPIGALENNWDEVTFWVDVSKVPELSSIKVNLSASSKYWETTGTYTLLADGQTVPETYTATLSGQLTLPAGFVGFVSVPFSSFDTANWALDIANPDLKLEIYFSEPTDGSVALLDNVQVRETGAVYLKGTETSAGGDTDKQPDGDDKNPTDNPGSNPETGVNAPWLLAFVPPLAILVGLTRRPRKVGLRK